MPPDLRFEPRFHCCGSVPDPSKFFLPHSRFLAATQTAQLLEEPSFRERHPVSFLWLQCCRAPCDLPVSVLRSHEALLPPPPGSPGSTGQARAAPGCPRAPPQPCQLRDTRRWRSERSFQRDQKEQVGWGPRRGRGWDTCSSKISKVLDFRGYLISWKGHELIIT